MIYLSGFQFPSKEREYDFVFGQRKTCYDTYYPFQIVSRHDLGRIDFEPITILYGGNGSGKTTALNVIAEKLKLPRDTRFNRSNFFETYLDLCDYQLEGELPSVSRIITSDDVFDFMLNLRALNDGINEKREDLFKECLDARYSEFHFRSLDDYEQLKKVNMARSKTQSKYVRENLMDNVREHSNGESALLYFEEKIQENGLYLLDEPENSLSPEKQMELVQFLENHMRFFGCQFVMATHSPFLLSIKGAKIYDMDEEVVDIKKWTKLSNVRTYYDFFKKHEDEFSEFSYL